MNILDDIKSISTTSLREYLESVGEKGFRAEQIHQWVFKHGIEDYDDMQNVAKSTKAKLKEKFIINSLNEESCLKSNDGTIKWLLKTRDDHHIETVLIPSMDRFAVCVSTQIGCAMGCKFCRTATMGIIRNLEAGEILEQCMIVKKFLNQQDKDLTNVIFMGMGEPLKNFNNVNLACQVLHNQKFFNLGKKRLTVSTSGVIPGIHKLLKMETPCRLAISLNGTNNEMRSRIMPINDIYPLEKLLEAVDIYIEQSGNHITFEYVMIKDITCTDQAAKELIKIAKERNCKINAIALNSNENDELQTPSNNEIDRFLKKIKDAQIQITTRQPRGRDILAACGQLAVKKERVQ